MGQTLFEPPDVNGWELGPGWFGTGAMLARMNFAASLAANQRFNVARAANRSTPEALVDWFLLEKLTPAAFELTPYRELQAYARAGITTWNATDGQVTPKVAGLLRLIVGAAEYQFV
jgi:hypothetical protein